MFGKINLYTENCTRLVLFLRLQEYKYEVEKSEMNESKGEYLKKSV